MFRVLFLILVVMSSVAFAQIDEKPKAYLFDEFGKISRGKWRKHIEKFKAKLQENRWSKKFSDGFVINYAVNVNELKKAESFARDFLFENCYDCFGNSRIIFIRADFVKNQKTQLWIVPADAEPPILISDEKVK
jgi:hypothetical protein